MPPIPHVHLPTTVAEDGIPFALAKSVTPTEEPSFSDEAFQRLLRMSLGLSTHRKDQEGWATATELAGLAKRRKNHYALPPHNLSILHLHHTIPQSATPYFSIMQFTTPQIIASIHFTALQLTIEVPPWKVQLWTIEGWKNRFRWNAPNSSLILDSWKGIPCSAC